MVLVFAIGGYLLIRQERATPAQPSILQELERSEGRAWAPGDTSDGQLPVRQEGQTLHVGPLTIDLTRPEEELGRCAGLFRTAHAEYRKDRKGAQARQVLREAGTALGRLLMANPSLGIPFFREMAKEPHPDVLLDMARILQVCDSPELRKELFVLLEAGGAKDMQRAAVVALARGPHPYAPWVLMKVWRRETDSDLRRKTVEILSGILVRVPADEPAKVALLDELRRAATGPRWDPDRPVEAVAVLVAAQDGALGAGDRTLVASLVALESDPARKSQLEHLAGKIRK